jgi:hypothetical protein
MRSLFLHKAAVSILISNFSGAILKAFQKILIAHLRELAAAAKQSESAKKAPALSGQNFVTGSKTLL